MKKLLTLITISVLIVSSFWITSANSFMVEEVEVIERDIIELLFTRELDDSLDAVREFILEDTETMDEVEVLLSEVSPDNPQKLTLMLDRFLEENTDYTITILDIKDINGDTIEAGIDSVFSFNTGTLSIWSSENSNDDINGNEDENIDDTHVEDEFLDDITFPEDDENLSEDSDVNNNHEEDYNDSENHNNDWDDELFNEDDWFDEFNAAAEIEDNGMWGTTLQDDELDSSTLTHAENNDALPDTWPEIILLILLTLLFTGWVMYIKNQKIS